MPSAVGGWDLGTNYLIYNYSPFFEGRKDFDRIKPLNIEEKNLPIDPYVLGCWLGDGSKQCGAITNETNNVLAEIQRRGYSLGPDISAENRTSTYTILGLYPNVIIDEVVVFPPSTGILATIPWIGVL